MKHPLVPNESEIMSIYPRYTDEGDTTLILCKDGGKLPLRSSVENVLNRLSLRRNRNLNMVRSWLYRGEDEAVPASRHLGRTLGISPMLILVPFKARKPVVSSDGALGYVNYKYLKDVRPSHRDDEYVTELVLKDGRVLLSMWTIPTINSRVEEVERILYRFHALEAEIIAEMHSLYYDRPYRAWDGGHEDKPHRNTRKDKNDNNPDNG